MKVVLSRCLTSTRRLFRDDWIWISAEFTTEKHTRATHTHKHTHILNDEKNHVKYHQIFIVLICYCQFEPPIAT